MYMSERRDYYLRREHAATNPDTVMSIITDGFAQSHCILPWIKNQFYLLLFMRQVYTNCIFSILIPTTLNRK